MQLKGINSDGTQSDMQEFDLRVVDATGAAYEPPVVIRYRLVSAKQRREAQRAAVELNKNPATRGMQKEINYERAGDLMLQQAILSWEGIYGDDGQPLVCSPQTIPYLPDHLKLQVLEAAQSTEAADTAESFRQPPELVRVVG